MNYINLTNRELTHVIDILNSHEPLYDTDAERELTQHVIDKLSGKYYEFD